MASEPIHRRLEFAGSLDLKRTVGPLIGPSPKLGVISEREFWRVSRTPAGPATIHVVPTDGGVEAAAWGTGASWALDQLPDLLGLGDDPASFKPDNRLVRDLHLRALGMRFGATRSVFELSLIHI